MKIIKVQRIVKGDKKLISSWVMYDWANSVFQLTILSAIFPIYYNQVTRSSDFMVSFFNWKLINSALYSWSIATAYLLFALMSPFFSALADYTGRRRAFMKFFTFLGAFSCALLFFFNSSNIEFGIIVFTLATFGYGGSLVFYNSFLPLIVDYNDQDKVSARGYSMGYLGGVVLLIINLIIILFPAFFGIHNSFLPAKIAFVSVAIWWIAFSQITFLKLPKYTLRQRNKGENLWFSGYSELIKVFNQIRHSKVLSLFLLAFFFTTMGLLTVMFMAAIYGEKELKLSDEILISTILVIQLLGMAGAYFFAFLSKKVGNLKSLIIAVSSWIFICFAAYYITDAMGFIIVAVFVGLVMGGSQALARSTYSKLLPETTDHTSFFSFYDVMEKLATVAGTFSFGFIESITGSMRYSILAIILFFVIGLAFFILLFRIIRKIEIKY